ncbi:MAG: efflux RND transporter permease subunit, partial [candidate division Zixibacteria bacterium]|nr:efflux RND transporter permease subunit [candidate division Zixibacteria bacterium]
MRRVVAYFIRHPIWTAVLLFGIIGFGVISHGRLRYSFFPEIVPDIITIQITYPGAAP